MHFHENEKKSYDSSSAKNQVFAYGNNILRK